MSAPPDEKLEIVKKYIVEAIRYSNMMSGYRRVVISENGYTIFGLVCNLPEFVKDNYPEYDDYKMYTQDSKERSIVAFIGIIFQSEKLCKDYIIDDFDKVVFSLFLKYMADEEKWYHKSINHYLSEPIEVKVKEYVKGEKISGRIKCCNKIIYPASNDNDRDLFLNCMSHCGGGDTRYLFCSDYYGIESVSKTSFQIITSNYIAKIQRYFENENDGSNVSKSNRKKTEQKKTGNIVGAIVILTIVLVIIVAVYMERRADKKMSRIDMSKPSAHEITASVDLELRNDKAESYVQYIEACGKLINKYKADIDFVEQMQTKLRDEKINFYENGLGRVKKALKEAGIPEELALEWVKEVRCDFNDSFSASEQILKNFSMSSLGEMKKKLEEIING
jgi:hypothetical protein